MKAQVGTHHFDSLRSVEKYYGKETTKSKLEEGAVCIGKPKLKEGQKLYINDEGRYFIEH